MRATGEQLGTKLDLTTMSNTLAAQGQHHQTKKKDTSDPKWLAKQTCWKCGKLRHICQGCTALQAEKEAYHMSKAAEQSTANIVASEPDQYAGAMIAETIINKPDVCMMARIVKCTEVTITETTFKHQAYAAREDTSELKPWVIDSGCSAHFSPNQSKFISYVPYASAQHICLGNSRVVPSMGKGTVSLQCLVDVQP